MRKRYRDCPCTSLPHSCLACSIVLIFIFMYVFIQLHWVLSEECGIFSCGMTIFCLVAECVIQFPDYGLNPGPLHWECWDLTTGPYWKSSLPIVQFSHVWLFATPWIAAHQASLFITNSWSSLKLMSIELVRPSNHLILCHPFLLQPSIFASIRVFFNDSDLRIRWSKDWSFNFSISPSSEYSELISFRINLFELLAFWGILKSSPAPQFESINSLALSLLYAPTLTSIHDSCKNYSFAISGYLLVAF